MSSSSSSFPSSPRDQPMPSTSLPFILKEIGGGYIIRCLRFIHRQYYRYTLMTGIYMVKYAIINLFTLCFNRIYMLLFSWVIMTPWLRTYLWRACFPFSFTLRFIPSFKCSVVNLLILCLFIKKKEKQFNIVWNEEFFFVIIWVRIIKGFRLKSINTNRYWIFRELSSLSIYLFYWWCYGMQ